MPNNNCLDGMRCPQCGSEGPFRINAYATFTVSDEGTEEFRDVGWNPEDPCNCCGCDHAGKVADFNINNQGWSGAIRGIIWSCGAANLQATYERVSKVVQQAIDEAVAKAQELPRALCNPESLKKLTLYKGDRFTMNDLAAIFELHNHGFGDDQIVEYVNEVGLGGDWRDLSFALTMRNIKLDWPEADDFNVTDAPEDLKGVAHEGVSIVQIMRGDEVIDWIDMDVYEEKYFVDIPSNEDGDIVPNERVSLSKAALKEPKTDVLPPGAWSLQKEEFDSFFEDWWALASDKGIIAYTHTESLAAFLQWALEEHGNKA